MAHVKKHAQVELMVILTPTDVKNAIPNVKLVLVLHTINVPLVKSAHTYIRANVKNHVLQAYMETLKPINVPHVTLTVPHVSLENPTLVHLVNLINS